MTAQILTREIREEWRPAPKSRYLISNHGRIYRHAMMVKCGTVYGRVFYRKLSGTIVVPSVDKRGYLRFNYGEAPIFVHRIVAEVFIENPDRLITVNHIDLDKKNNCVTNLEWLSNRDNVLHAWANNAFTHTRPVRCINTGHVYETCAEAAIAYGLAKGNLTSHLKGRQRSFGGCQWEYVQ